MAVSTEAKRKRRELKANLCEGYVVYCGNTDRHRGMPRVPEALMGANLAEQAVAYAEGVMAFVDEAEDE